MSTHIPLIGEPGTDREPSGPDVSLNPVGNAYVHVLDVIAHRQERTAVTSAKAPWVAPGGRMGCPGAVCSGTFSPARTDAPPRPGERSGGMAERCWERTTHEA